MMLQKVISAFSYSGGVGKSTLIKELACLYSSPGLDRPAYSVCVIDAVPDFGSQHILFGLSPRKTLLDLMEEICQQKETQSDFEIVNRYEWEMIEPYLSLDINRNIYILPSIAPWDPFFTEHSNMHCIVQILRKFFDMILIDTGNLIYPVTKDCLASSSSKLLLVTDNRSCLLNAARWNREEPDLLKSQDVIPVLNRYPLPEHNRTFTREEVSTLLKLPVRHILPETTGLWMLNNIQEPLVLHHERSELQDAIYDLAKDIDLLDN